jgi:hypothetical protein
MRATTIVLDGADNSSEDKQREKKETTVSNKNTTIAANKLPLHAIKGVYDTFAPTSRFTQSWGNPGIPVMEFPINSFKHWYKDLRFAKYLLNHSNLFEGNREWDFKVIVINKSSWLGEHQKRDEAALKWAQQVAINFYKDIFLPNEKDFRSIEDAVQHNKTVMIIVVHSDSSAKKAPTFVGTDEKNMTTVASVTFKEGINNDSNLKGKPRPALILWIGVQDPRHGNCDAPADMNKSWRRQGFGIFLLIHVIKHCIFNKHASRMDYESSSAKEYPASVDIYLQCTIQSAYQFYLSVGFIHINNSTNDGWALLPASLQNVLSSAPHSFIRYVPNDGHPPCKLMHLRPGHLQQPTIEVDCYDYQVEYDMDVRSIIEKKGSKMDVTTTSKKLLQDIFTWCRYPAAKVGFSSKVVYSDKHFESAMADLPLVQNLLPPPYNRLLPATSFRFGGEMTSDSRVVHSEQEGTEWMKTSEMNMMLALLLRDGRYEEYASVLSVELGVAIGNGYAYHNDAKWATELKESLTLEYAEKGEMMPETEFDVIVRQVKSKTYTHIMKEYERSLNYILEKWIDPNPGLLSKRLIAIPYCVNNDHWVVSFVFNPGNVLHHQDDTQQVLGSLAPRYLEDGIRPCFFHYCPLGRESNPSHKWGIVWFLNLAYSYRKLKEQPENHPDGLKWYHPFGNPTQPSSLWKGQEALPALKFTRPDTLPQQTDGWNCAFGVVATIGIILRDVVGNYGNEERYLNMFQVDTLPIKYCAEKMEWYCLLPPRALQRVSGDTPRNDYLCRLRREWFVLFDRFAKLQNVTIPSEIDKDLASHSRQYEVTAGKIRWPEDLFSQNTKIPRRTTTDGELAAAASIMELAETHPPISLEIMDARRPRHEQWVEKKCNKLNNQLQTQGDHDENETLLSTPEQEWIDPEAKPRTFDITSSNIHGEKQERFGPPNEIEYRKKLANTIRQKATSIVKEHKSSPTKKESSKKNKSRTDVSPSTKKRTSISMLKKKSFTPDKATNATPERVKTTLTQKLSTKKTTSSPNRKSKANTKELPDPSCAIVRRRSKRKAVTQEEVVLGDEGTDVATLPSHQTTGANSDHADNSDAVETKKMDSPPCSESPRKDVKSGVSQVSSITPTKKPKEKRRIAITFVGPLGCFNAEQVVEHHDNDHLRRSPRHRKNDTPKVLPQKRSTGTNSKILVPHGTKKQRSLFENESIIWADEPNKKQMAWWKEELNEIRKASRKEKETKTVNASSSEYVRPALNLALLKNYVSYRSGLPSRKQMTNTLVPTIHEETMEAFIQRSFKKWGWHDEEEFTACVKFYADEAKKASAKKDSYLRKYCNAMHRCMKKERILYRRRLKAEYLCSVPAALESVKYRRDFDQFVGLMVFMRPDPLNPGKFVKEYLKERINEEWVRSAYSPEMVDHIINLDSACGFARVPPTSEPVRVHNKTIDRVRYRPPFTVFVPDTPITPETIREDKQSLRTRHQKTQERMKRSEPLKKEINVPGSWVARVGGMHLECDVEESLLVEKFGKVYVDEVKKLYRGFVDVPVGEQKESRLHQYPNLRVSGAPSIRFIQSEGRDLCVSKSLASALFAIGFVKEAEIIDEFGEKNLAGNVVDAFQKVKQKAVSVLPSWLQVKKIPLDFVWHRDLPDSSILLAVLSASDGHRNHAVTIHGGFIYDANEKSAIPFNQEGMDYCVSTDLQSCRFVNFRRGFMFSYKGQKKTRMRMMLPLNRR